MTEIEMTKAILDHYGVSAQVVKAREELLELRDELGYWLCWGDEVLRDVVDEIADVENMLNSLKLAYSLFEQVDSIRVAKLKRTLERIDKGKEGDK